MSQQTLDYRQHLVLFVDDEQKTRKYFAKLFGKNFRVILAEDGVAGLERFREYQDEVEQLYFTALAFTFERFEFTTQWFYRSGQVFDASGEFLEDKPAGRILENELGIHL